MADLLLHVAFVFAVLGTKLVLALWAIYYLLPAGAACPECDGDTLPLQLGTVRRVFGALLFLGQVRRRWCPACSWDGLVRRSPSRGDAVRPLAPAETADHPV